LHRVRIGEHLADAAELAGLDEEEIAVALFDFDDCARELDDPHHDTVRRIGTRTLAYRRTAQERLGARRGAGTATPSGSGGASHRRPSLTVGRAVVMDALERKLLRRIRVATSISGLLSTFGRLGAPPFLPGLLPALFPALLPGRSWASRTEILRPKSSLPSSSSIASRRAVSSSSSTKPKPLDLPVSRSTTMRTL